MSSRPKDSTARVDHPLRAREVGHVLVVGDGSAAGRADLFDDLVGRQEIGSLASERRAEVVDDDLRTGAGEREGVLAADPAARSGDDRDLPVE